MDQFIIISLTGGYNIRIFNKSILNNLLHLAKIKTLTLLFALFLISARCSKHIERIEQPPNIVLIMADDLGTEVLGCYGGTSYDTPNIDKLANTGLKFNHCYSSPVCSPTRVNLITGRYGFRTGQTWGVLPEDEITFGQVLKSAGYKTALSGKWQMSLLKENPDHITENGFEQNSVFGWHEGPRYHEPMIYPNGKIRTDVKDKYGPDVFTQFISDFIVNNKEGPFLAYYPMALAHEISNDLQTPPPVGPQGRYQTYKELVEYADVLVGKVIQLLDEQDLRENTLILFTADNGTPYHFITKYENGKYIREPVYSAIGDSLIRGGKSFLTDAGTHVPLIANWQGVTSPGAVNNNLIDFSDFMPTFAELANAKLPDDRTIDGKSFVLQIKGVPGEVRQWAFVEWEGDSWIRTQAWKLYSNGYLFDMKNDRGEKRPISMKDDSETSKKIRNYLKEEEKLLKDSGEKK